MKKRSQEHSKKSSSSSSSSKILLEELIEDQNKLFNLKELSQQMNDSLKNQHSKEC